MSSHLLSVRSAHFRPRLGRCSAAASSPTSLLRRRFVAGAAFHRSLVTILLVDQTGIRGGEIKRKKIPFSCKAVDLDNEEDEFLLAAAGEPRPEQQ
jgi:hypothetical protein